MVTRHTPSKHRLPDPRRHAVQLAVPGLARRGRLGHLRFGRWKTDSYLSLGMLPADMISAALTTMGCDDVSISATPDMWSISLTAAQDAKLLLLAAGIAALIPHNVDDNMGWPQYACSACG